MVDFTHSSDIIESSENSYLIYDTLQGKKADSGQFISNLVFSGPPIYRGLYLSFQKKRHIELVRKFNEDLKCI